MAGASSTSLPPSPVKALLFATSPSGHPRVSFPAATPAFFASSVLTPSRRAALLPGSRGGVVLPSVGPQLSASFRVRARAVTDDDEWGKDAPEGPPAAATVAQEEGEAAAIGELKKKLKELLYGTNRGLTASSESRAEIVELITQLEARNPTPAPTEALSLLNGKWILA